MSLALIWLAVALGFVISRSAEWWRHRCNYQILRAAGAKERSVLKMRLYYLINLAVLPAAMAEQFYLAPTVHRDLIVGGLLLCVLGLALRAWAISSLGSLWTMRCMALKGLTHRRVGPYRWLDNPEYFSRLMDGIGFCLVFGAKLTACVYLVLALILERQLVAAERRQCEDLQGATPDLQPLGSKVFRSAS